MATLRNKRKLVGVTREAQEEHPKNGQSRNMSVPRINEEYNTQISEEIEGRVTKTQSQDFSRTEFRILGALSKLGQFLLNPQIRTHSGTVPETFGNTNVDNQGTTEEDSQSDSHPEAGIFCRLTTQISSPEVGHDMVKGVTEDIRNRHDIVTGVQEEIRYRPHMVTGNQENIPFCILGTSGKKKKARFTSQPQVFIENTPATVETDQILLALQSMASKINSANINNNIDKI